MVKSVKKSSTKNAPRATTSRRANGASGGATSVTQTSVTYTNPFAAYRAFWKRGFTDWRGTTSRSEFWLAALVNACIMLGALGIIWVLYWATMHYNSGIFAFFGLVSVIGLGGYCLAIIVPEVSMAARRLHDAGFSAWWLVVYVMSSALEFVNKPWAGVFSWILWVMFVVFMLLPTKTRDNPYHKFNK